jgi:hypothetical protein
VERFGRLLDKPWATRLATAITIGGFVWIVVASAWAYLSSTGIIGAVLTGSFALAAFLVILGLGTLAIQEARARGWLRGALAYRELHVWYADQDGYFVGDLDAYGALRDSLETLTANAAKLGHRVIAKGPDPAATRPPNPPASRTFVAPAPEYAIGGVSGPVPTGLTRYRGKVTDAFDGSPVAQVRVFAQSRPAAGAITDGEGEWAIDLLSGQAWLLRFDPSRIINRRYETTERTGVDGATVIDVALRQRIG